MALDRFIHFDEGTPPTFDQIRDVCVHYVGGAGSIDLQPPRIFAVLPGVSESPTARPERFIEIYVADDMVDVMTRQADAFTNALAEGLANIICLQLNGKREYNGSFPSNYAQDMDGMAKHRWKQRFGDSWYPGGPLAAYDTMLAIAELYPEALAELIDNADKKEITIAKRSDGRYWISDGNWSGDGMDLLEAIEFARDRFPDSPFLRWLVKRN